MINEKTHFLDNKTFVMLISVIIFAFGLIFLNNATPYNSVKGTSVNYVSKQLFYGIIGLISMIGVYNIPLKYYEKYAYHIIIGAFILMLLVFFPVISVRAGGARRWIGIGHVTFQPSELMKLAFIIYLSKSLPGKGRKLNDFWMGFFPYMLILFLITVVLFAQKDLGTTIVMGSVLIAMLFVGGVPFKYIGGFIFLILFIMGIGIYIERYRLLRFLAFFNPWKYSSTFGYQQTRSLLAYVHGGITGKAGASVFKQYFLPESHTDFIFAIVGEDGGLMMVTLIMFIFITLIFAGYRIAESQKDRFKMMLAFGITTVLATEIAINIAVTVVMLPNKGLPLPFISYGGSNLLVSFIMVGILARIRRESV